jgi:hypothetical protein
MRTWLVSGARQLLEHPGLEWQATLREVGLLDAVEGAVHAAGGYAFDA